MTQLPRRPFATLPPPPDGLAVVRREAARRRRQRTIGAAAGSAGVGATVAVIVLLTGGGAGGDAILRPAPMPAASQPAPTSTFHPEISLNPVSSGRATPAATVAPASTRSAATATATPSATTSTQAPSEPRAGLVLTRTSSHYSGSPQVCEGGFAGSSDNTTQASANWCPSASATRSDGGIRLAYTICRDSTGAGSLAFESSREVELAVSAGSKTVWAYSHAQPGSPDRHVLSAKADDCWTWSLDWPGVDDAGHAVAHGTYTLSASSTATDRDRLQPTQVQFRW